MALAKLLLENHIYLKKNPKTRIWKAHKSNFRLKKRLRKIVHKAGYKKILFISFFTIYFMQNKFYKVFNAESFINIPHYTHTHIYMRKKNII